MSLYEEIVPEVAALKRVAETELRKERDAKDLRMGRLILDKIKNAMKEGLSSYIVYAYDLPHSRDTFSEVLQARGYRIKEGRSSNYLMHWTISWD